MDSQNSERPRWYIARGGERQGPFTLSAIAALAENDAIESGDLVWRPGFLAWMEAGEVPGLLIPPPLPESTAATSPSAPHAPRQRETRRSSHAGRGTSQVRVTKGAEESSQETAETASASLTMPKAGARAEGDRSAVGTGHESEVTGPTAEGVDADKLRILREKLIDTIERQQQ